MVTIRQSAVRFEYKFIEEGAPAGTFEGYGSVFGNEDDNGDVILPGAFASVLARHQAKGTMPKMLLNHGSMGGGFFGTSDPMADLPIGKWTSISEDSHGLPVKGRLINLDTERGKNIYGAMKEGELGGLSIGYRAGDFVRGTKPNEPRRTIKSMKNLIEVSPVTFPANELATVSGVKSLISTERAFERLLMRDAGLSQAEALIVMNRGVKALLAMRASGGTGLADVLSKLRSTRQLINPTR